jgi:hypothetical protein
VVAVPLTADVCLQVKIGASARLQQSDFGSTFDRPDSHALAEMLGEIGEYCATRGEPCCQLLRSTSVAINRTSLDPASIERLSVSVCYRIARPSMSAASSGHEHANGALSTGATRAANGRRSHAHAALSTAASGRGPRLLSERRFKQEP